MRGHGMEMSKPLLPRSIRAADADDRNRDEVGQQPARKTLADPMQPR